MRIAVHFCALIVLTLRPKRAAISVTPNPDAYWVNTSSSRRDNILRTKSSRCADRCIGDQRAHRRPEIALARQRRDDRHVNQIDPVALAHQSVDTERDDLLQRGRFGFHGEHDERDIGDNAS